MTYDVVYLDRDNTINKDVHYLSHPDDFEFCEGAIEGLSHISAIGLPMVIITNQSGVGRGVFDIETLNQIHKKMELELSRFAVEFKKIYFCPHHPDERCLCRKPLPGLIQQAQKDFGFRSGVMIGDSPRDLIAGRASGNKTIGIQKEAKFNKFDRLSDFNARDLIEAAEWIARTHLAGSE